MYVVLSTRRRHPVNGSYQFYLFIEGFTIPERVVQLRELLNGLVMIFVVGHVACSKRDRYARSELQTYVDY
jgi:hypothetical protein